MSSVLGLVTSPSSSSLSGSFGSQVNSLIQQFIAIYATNSSVYLSSKFPDLVIIANQPVLKEISIGFNPLFTVAGFVIPIIATVALFSRKHRLVASIAASILVAGIGFKLAALWSPQSVGGIFERVPILLAYRDDQFPSLIAWFGMSLLIGVAVETLVLRKSSRGRNLARAIPLAVLFLMVGSLVLSNPILQTGDMGMSEVRGIYPSLAGYVIPSYFNGIQSTMDTMIGTSNAKYMVFPWSYDSGLLQLRWDRHLFAAPFGISKYTQVPAANLSSWLYSKLPFLPNVPLDLSLAGVEYVVVNLEFSGGYGATWYTSNNSIRP